MKKFLAYTKITFINFFQLLITLVIFYGLLALCKWDINIAHWQWTRAFFVIVSFILFVHVFMLNITEMKQEKNDQGAMRIIFYF